MLLAILLVLCATIFPVNSASSIPVATSTIISKITSQVVSTSSSIIGTSTITSTFASCSTIAVSNGNSSTECKGGQGLTVSTIYGSTVVTFTSVYETTIGYSTIYSSIKDGTSSRSTTDTNSKTSTSQVTTSSATTSEASKKTSTISISETRQSSTTTDDRSSSTTTESSQTTAVSGSQTSTTALSESSTTADGGQLLDSTGMKALFVVIILAVIGLFSGIAFLVVKRRRAKKAQQALLGDKTTKNDVEKTEMQVLITRPSSEMMHEKASLYPEPRRSASNASSVYTIASFEMSAESRPSSFYGAQGTQKYEMVGTTTAVYELDSGDYDFQNTKR